MTDRASVGVPGRPVAPRWPLKRTMAGMAIVVAIAVFLGAPYAFNSATLSDEIGDQIRSTVGLKVTMSGRVRFDLLPRPHIVAKGLRVTDPTGTLAVDAAELRGNVRLLPLVVGRVELTGVTLIRPHLTIDLDGRPMPADSTIGRAMRSLAPDGPDAGHSLGNVTLFDGTAVVKTRHLLHPPAFEAVNVTIDWPNLDSPATLTGSVEIAKTAADVAAWVAQPSGLMRGDHSAVTLNIHSVPLDLSANGDLVSADTTTFRGRISVDTPSGTALMGAGDFNLPAPAPFANLSLASDATIAIDASGYGSVDLPSLHLHVDDNDYEGTLAFQSGPKPLVSGTLASDQLSLAPFLGRLPPALDQGRHWSQMPLGGEKIRSVNLDLRISAGHLRLAPYTIDDAALSVMTRDDRTEVALIEGKMDGGNVNGHLSIGQLADGESAPGLSVRAAGSLEDVDAAALSWDSFGRQLAAGTLSASVNVEGTGASPAALVASLRGSVKAALHEGELSTIDLGRAIHADSTKGPGAITAALGAGRTPVDAFDLGLRIFDGLATIGQGQLRGSDANLVLGGDIDIARRRVDLMATASAPPAATGPAAPSSVVAFDIAGPLGEILVSAKAAQVH